MHDYDVQGPSVVELCAGAGGQALGLESAGYKHLQLVEVDSTACATLRLNRPAWPVLEADLRRISLSGLKPELLAAGLPCPPFSVAGRQLGPEDERNLFDIAIDLIEECRPTAIMIENVKGLAMPRFASYRADLQSRLSSLGYKSEWQLLNACDFGVAQLRPRFVLVALKKKQWKAFIWPIGDRCSKTVGEVLLDLMAANGWRKARAWAKSANKIAPTIVGGSKKHGGPDLGPTRAREAWASINVDGSGIAALPPISFYSGMPKLTLEMVARLQGFDDSWRFHGTKTSKYRQIGNAFPPLVAEAVGRAIYRAL